MRGHAAPVNVYRLGTIIVVLSAMLAGCASLPLERGAGIVPGGFELVGRVAVRHGSQGASAQITWRHSPNSDDMMVTSMFGQGIARIERRDGRFELVAADQRRYVASDAESLTEKVLGWRLPLIGLTDWVQGRPDPARPARVERDARSRISGFTQDGWHIAYQEFDGSRPVKLNLSRGDLDIRLVVDQWYAPK